MKSWYRLDTNADPPRYVLRNLTDIRDPVYWGFVLPAFGYLLRGVAFEAWGESLNTPPGEDFVIGQSVTEWEVRSALLQHPERDINRIRWLHRRFSSGVTKEDEKHWDFDDTLSHEHTRNGFDKLWQWMDTIFSAHGLTKTYDGCSFHDFQTESEAWKQQLEDWKRFIFQELKVSLDEVIRRKESWNKDGDGLGLPGSVLSDMFHHYQWAAEKNRLFFGREDLVRSVVERVFSTDTRGSNSPFSGISVAVIGGSGCGKTALMSRVAAEVWRRQQEEGLERPVIIRFCGTSPESNHGLNLVKSIIAQIAMLVEGAEDLMALWLSLDDLSYEDCVKKLQDLVAAHPVVLFIDSLDQLSNENLARSDVSFLKGVRPHRDSRIIVSALPDDVPATPSAGENISSLAKNSFFTSCC